MKTCKKCGNAARVTDVKCPKCGSWFISNAIGVGCGGCGCLMSVFVLIAILVTGNDRAQQEPKSSAPRDMPVAVYSMGEEFTLGTTTYEVHAAWWEDFLDDYLRDRNRRLEAANAEFLFVSLTVKNADTKPRFPPSSFSLVDDRGARFEPDDRNWLMRDSLDAPDAWASLNPGVSRSALVAFDCADDRQYWIKLSGGSESSGYALVKLNPRAHR